MGTRRYAKVLLASLLVLAVVLAGGLAGVVNLAAAAPIYTIVVQVSPLGSGTVDVVPNETDYELTASPATGWHFVDWSGDVTVADSPVTVTTGDTATITPPPGPRRHHPGDGSDGELRRRPGVHHRAGAGYHVADVKVDGARSAP